MLAGQLGAWIPLPDIIESAIHSPGLTRRYKSFPNLTDLNTVFPKNVLPMKVDWYQSESHLVVSILTKGTQLQDINVQFSEDQVLVTAKIPECDDYDLKLNLASEIKPDGCSYKVTPTKIEIKLAKSATIHWSILEKVVAKVEKEEPVGAECVKPATQSKDWDKIVTDIVKQDGDENGEGDAALNNLFQKIYADGSDEVKKAMNKSFMESGGTVLSTNWSDVQKEKVDVKPPDGMEWRKWEQ